ncbi:YveK family protein [Paenibacillus marinisediminis]
MELQDLLHVIKKRFWFMTVFVLLISVSVGYISFNWITPKYEAASKLLVNNLSDNNPAPVDVNTINMNIMLINSYKEILQSARIKDKVLERYPDLQPHAGLLQQVRIISGRESQVMTLTLVDTSYQRAAEIVNAMATVFKEDIPQLMKVDNVSVLDLAKLDDHAAPISPNHILNLMIAFVLSSMFMLAISLMLEKLDDTIKTEAEVEGLLGLPALGAVMRVKQSDLKEKAVRVNKKQAGELNAKTSA